MSEKAYIASWSGGKDSTYMVDELLRRCEPLDEVIFCDTGFEFPEMYDYIQKCKAYWEAKYPDLKITLINYGKGREIWDKWALGDYTKGEHEGTTRGFPFPIGMSWCTRELKLLPTQNYIKEHYQDCEVYEYVGIAFDEPKRVPNGWENGKTLFPMVEWGVTEDQANAELRKRGMFNELYNDFSRTGCWICPKQGSEALLTLKENYSHLYEQIKPMESKYKELWCEKGYKNVGIDSIEVELVSNPTDGFSFDDEPRGCFCK